jgi:signal transduction histidine kinase
VAGGISSRSLIVELGDVQRALDELGHLCVTPAAEDALANAHRRIESIERRLAASVDTELGLEELGDAIFRLASLDFSQTLQLRGDDSVLDGIRSCVNMLSEELGANQRQLTRAKVLAEEAAAAKSEFLSNMSHELRTPMHAILSYTEMSLDRLAGDLDRAKLGKYLTNIRVSGRRLLSLIDDLLDLSKLEAGKMPIAPVVADFMEVINHGLLELGSSFKKRALVPLVRRETADTRACFDFHRMVQVLENVLGNALRFADSGSAIELGLSDGPGVLTCTVRNQGPTIPPDELESIFDRFVQSSKVKSGAGGTGLGLAICRAIVDAHGGRIWAENHDGGVSLHLSLPRQHP